MNDMLETKQTVYVLCENVDLGYHVHGVYFDETKAAEECALQNTKRRESIITDLMQGFGYSQEKAEEFAAQDDFFIETHEVKG